MSLRHGLSDAMSDVLALVRVTGEFVSVNAFAEPWSLAFDPPAAHIHIVESGVAWIRTAGALVRLEAGDFALLPKGLGHVLASAPDLAPVPIDRALEGAVWDGLVWRLGGDGPETRLLCGEFTFEGPFADRLLGVLPPVIHVAARAGTPLDWLRLTTAFLIEEVRRPSQGSAIMVSRLLDLLFIQALRHWGGRSDGQEGPPAGGRGLGWLAGLRDPSVGRALSAMHGAPARTWTVAQLAASSGLSRSAFAARFVASVGETPSRYLAGWRLALAAGYLRAGRMRLGEIAALVGYGSEAALARAFKARFGIAPARFRRDGTSLDR